jgi:putative ABC transport system permease protein
VDPTESNARGTGTNVVGADYFESLGVTPVAGRQFTRAEEESPTAPPVAIVDRVLAEALWPGESAVGRRIEVVDQPNREYGIVGVVPAVQTHLFESDAGQIYLPFGRHFQSNLHFHLRTSGLDATREQALLGQIRRELAAVDGRLPILGITTMAGQLDGSIELWTLKIAGKLFGLFGTLALFIAAVGAYGLRAYAVGQRTREIGLRMALGATPRNTLELFLREGVALALVGLGLGLAIALAVARLLSSLLYEVSAYDPLVFSIAPLFLIAAITLACWVPARRAARVDPMVALRDE